MHPAEKAIRDALKEKGWSADQIEESIRKQRQSPTSALNVLKMCHEELAPVCRKACDEAIAKLRKAGRLPKR